MTLTNFNSDQLLFAEVKKIMDKLGDEDCLDSDDNLSNIINGIILCSFACESFMNLFLQNIQFMEFKNFEQRTIKQKFDMLYEKKGVAIDWSSAPFNYIILLTKAKNYLLNYRKSDLQWIDIDKSKTNKISNLDVNTLYLLYHNCKYCVFEATKLYQHEEHYGYLED